jgi:sigma-B regulation protein RsbU (phosphoserine phosphatase)
MGYTTILQSAFDSKIERDVIDKVRKVAKVSEYPAGTVLCHQGELEKTFYIVVKGLVSVSKTSEDGEKKFLGKVGPNEYFGEMGLIDDRPRIATCKALNDVTVIEITDEIFDTIIAKSPVVAFHITQHILKSMRRLDEMAIEELREKNRALEEAYADLKAAQAQIIEKERMEHEIKLAADVQDSLLPDSFPEYTGYDISAYLQPAKSVGGDFYDVIEIDDENIGLLIADVADKGIHAAMFMAVTRTLFFTVGHQFLSPSKVATAVHRSMMEVAPKTDVFVTAFYGVLNKPSGRLTYVRAGHEKPLLFRPGKPVGTLAGQGRFLGMIEELQLPEYTFQLKPGDRLVLYSDGVTDSTNPAGEQFGTKRFARCIKTNGALAAADISRAIQNDVADFCKGAPPFDDLTLLVLAVV